MKSVESSGGDCSGRLAEELKGELSRDGVVSDSSDVLAEDQAGGLAGDHAMQSTGG